MSNNNKTTQLKQLKEVPGLLTCVLEHEVTRTKGKFTWEGPVLNGIWPQILAFFKWTYDDHRSESQVRLYVNTVSPLWGAYAHPQEAKTGMSARTLNIAETEEQTIARCTLMGDPDPAHWMYFGTVHHHCGMGAFQSSVDENDEKDTDGLHITVGKMDEKKHDLHARLYISGNRFDPDLSWFWDVGEIVESIPRGLRRFLKEGMEHDLALEQMCQPAPKEVEFPVEWRENVIEIKRSITPVYQGGLGFSSSFSKDWNYDPGWRSHKLPSNYERDVRLAANELLEYWEENQNQGDLLTFLESLEEGSHEICELIENLYRNDVSLGALFTELERREKDQIRQEISGADQKQLKQDNGVPDYSGTDYGSGYGQ